MNALQIIQATVEPEPGSQEIKVLRAACRRHGFPGPRFDPHGMTGATSRPGNYQCWVFGPHNMFMLVESRLDNDGEVLSHPWIRVLPHGHEEAASIVIYGGRHAAARDAALGHTLNRILSVARDPKALSALLRSAVLVSHDLESRLNNAFQARATVEPEANTRDFNKAVRALCAATGHKNIDKQFNLYTQLGGGPAYIQAYVGHTSADKSIATDLTVRFGCLEVSSWIKESIPHFIVRAKAALAEFHRILRENPTEDTIGVETEIRKSPVLRPLVADRLHQPVLDGIRRALGISAVARVTGVNALSLSQATVEPSNLDFATKLKAAGLQEVRGAPYYRFMDPSRWLRVDMFDNGGPHVNFDLDLGGLDVISGVFARNGARIQMLFKERNPTIQSLYDVFAMIKPIVRALRHAETTDDVFTACQGLVAPGILTHVKAGRAARHTD